MNALSTSLHAVFVLAPVCVALSGCVVSCQSPSDDDCVDCNEGGSWAYGGSYGQGASGGAGGEGGAVPCDPSLLACECQTDAECAAGLSCVGSTCLPACGFDFECGDAHVCAEGQCVPACDPDFPCAEHFVCTGGACLPDASNPECSSPTDCSGLPCVDGFCTTACLSHADCGVGELCEESSGACILDQGPVPVCSAELPCPGAGQTCLDGFCRYACETLEECKLIDARFDACDANVCKTDTELNPECTLGVPCPAGELCVSNECTP